MNRKLLTALGIAALVCVAIAGAHFLSASATQSGNDLVVTFREAGLGEGDVTIQASADATAVYACINGGDKNPSAANKRTVNATVSNSSVFTPKNGSVRGSLTINPPGPGDFTCPGGQTLTLESVSYSNVT